MKLPDDLSVHGFGENLINLHGLPPKPGKDLVKYIAENFTPAKTIYRMSSYGLKHYVEDCLKRYVTNGEMIRAMLETGYKHKRCPDKSPNCWFYMKKINWQRLQKTIFSKQMEVL